MKLFQKISMASETVDSFVKSAVAASEMRPGDLVVITGLAESSAYTAPNHSVFEVAAPKSVAGLADAALYIVDPVINPTATSNIDSTLSYRVGHKTLGQPAPAGEIFRIRKLQIGDMFYLGTENFAVKPTTAELEKHYSVGANLKTHAEVALTGVGAITEANYLARLEQITKISQGVGTAGLQDAYVLTVVKA